MRRFVVLTLLAALLAPVGSVHAALGPQDDAGSGTDAPDLATATFRIEPEVVYDGTLEGQAPVIQIDDQDWYAFDAPAGAQIDAAASGPSGCVYVYDDAGTQLAVGCTEGYLEDRATAIAPAAGTYYLSYQSPVGQSYRFSLGVGSPAPSPAPNAVPDLFPETGDIPPVAAASQTDAHVVVAVVDTGVNLYHEFFRAPGLTAHPSSWLAGFPAGATTVNLSLGAADYATARAADAATFAGIDRSTYDAGTDSYDEHLYTFPGTRFVGGVSFGEFEDPVFPLVDPRPIGDDVGHGTHSAGLAGGANLAAADGNVLLVAVEVGQGTFEEGVRWAARQPWIDALSLSLGLRANVPVTDSPTGDRAGMEWATREAHLAGKPVLMASNNGLSDTGRAPDRCTTYTSSFTGPSWITRIGAAEPDDGSATWWHCVPVEAIARTDARSPDFDSLTGASAAGGTSAATPNAAGHWAHLMLAARRASSTATRIEALDHLLHAAQPAPLAVGAHSPSVYPLSLAEQGYGLIDGAALAAATDRLLANLGPHPRPETEAWFANDAAIRTKLWGPGSLTAGPAPS